MRRFQSAPFSWRDLVEPVAVALTCAAAAFAAVAVAFRLWSCEG